MPHSRAFHAISLAPAILLSLAAAACSSSSAPIDATADSASGCSNDPRVQSVASGVAVAGATHQLTLALVSLTPATVTSGVNDWTIELRDATGKPVEGATIGVTSFMPDHGHGASVVPTVTPLGGGRYHVANLSLPMPGVWQLTFDAETASGTHDVIVITACVQS
jgi:hypothetical protein